MMRAVQPPAAYWEGRALGIVAAVLAMFGVVAVYSASSIWAVQNALPGGYYAVRQLLGAGVGVGFLLICSRIDYQLWRYLGWPLLAATAVMLVIPLLPFTTDIAPEINGARRWVTLGPIRMQPSEFARFTLVAWTAMLAAKKGVGIREFKSGLLPFLVIVIPVVGLVILEPDLSSGIVLLLLVGTVLFTAGAKIGHFLLLGLVALPFLWHSVVSVQYRLTRMLSFLGSPSDVEEASWQIQQSLIGIGSGRWFGVGFGEGLQKLGYLPYAYSDFIFSTIGEEWGFVGVLVIVGLFAGYMALGFRIARAAPDLFGSLLATGLTTAIGLAAMLHVAVTLNLTPTTGISLPFVSYGRSSLLVSLIATGVLINISSSRAGPVRR